MKMSLLRESVLFETGGEGERWELFVFATFCYYGVLPAHSIERDFDVTVDFFKLF